MLISRMKNSTQKLYTINKNDFENRNNLVLKIYSTLPNSI